MGDSGQGEVWRSIGSVVPSFPDWLNAPTRVVSSEHANFYSKGCVSIGFLHARCRRPNMTIIRHSFLGRLRQLNPIENPYAAVTRTVFEVKELR
jgi:hypothetical protein